MNLLQALALVILTAMFTYMITMYYHEPRHTKKTNFKQRDYQLDIYDTIITLYRGNGLYYVGKASVNKLDSLIMEDNR